MVSQNYHVQGPTDKSSTSFNMRQIEAIPGEAILRETKVWMSRSQASAMQMNQGGHGNSGFRRGEIYIHSYSRVTARCKDLQSKRDLGEEVVYRIRGMII